MRKPGAGIEVFCTDRECTHCVKNRQRFGPIISDYRTSGLRWPARRAVAAVPTSGRTITAASGGRCPGNKFALGLPV